MRIPLHLKANDFSPKACEARAELAAVMAGQNPNGFRPPSETHYSLAEKRAVEAGMMEPNKGRTQSARGQRKAERRQMAKDAIREVRLDFIERFEKNVRDIGGGFASVARYTAYKDIEKRRKQAA